MALNNITITITTQNKFKSLIPFEGCDEAVLIVGKPSDELCTTYGKLGENKLTVNFHTVGYVILPSYENSTCPINHSIKHSDSQREKGGVIDNWVNLKDGRILHRPNRQSILRSPPNNTFSEDSKIVNLYSIQPHVNKECISHQCQDFIHQTDELDLNNEFSFEVINSDGSLGRKLQLALDKFEEQSN